MNMSRDLLAGLEMPSNDSCVSRLGDDGANGLTVGWSEKL
jgi:hypothetical protein